MIVQFSMKEAFREDGKCTIQIEYNRNLQIHGSRYERRRSRSKVDSFYNCKILKDKGVLRMCKYSIKVKYDRSI